MKTVCKTTNDARQILGQMAAKIPQLLPGRKFRNFPTKVLIVEDENFQRGILHYLQQEGYVCREAIQLPKHTEGVAYDYDCILWTFPCRMVMALGILGKLKERNKTDGVIVVSHGKGFA